MLFVVSAEPLPEIVVVIAAQPMLQQWQRCLLCHRCYESLLTRGWTGVLPPALCAWSPRRQWRQLPLRQPAAASVQGQSCPAVAACALPHPQLWRLCVCACASPLPRRWCCWSFQWSCECEVTGGGGPSTIFLLYPTITKQVVVVLRCSRDIDGSSYLEVRGLLLLQLPIAALPLTVPRAARSPIRLTTAKSAAPMHTLCT